jgi:hypothetical protein
LAGTLNVDTLKADSNLKLQIASANVAFIDANGLTIVGNSLNVGGGRIVVTSNNSISTPTVIGANLVTATGTTALGITANGQITTANAPFILTGGQLQFPATQIASGDGNCLDDYEEGTFTLTITPGSGSLTSYDRYGYYIKTGRQVMITCAFSIINAGTASGVANFDGLPFTSLTLPTLTWGGNRAATSAWREDGATGNWFFGKMDSNATSGVITNSTNGAITWTAGYAYVASFVYQSAV